MLKIGLCHLYDFFLMIRRLQLKKQDNSDALQASLNRDRRSLRLRAVHLKVCQQRLDLNALVRAFGQPEVRLADPVD